MGNMWLKPIKIALAFVILFQCQVSAKPVLALGLLAGAATRFGCDKGARCIQQCNVCEQVAFNFDAEQDDVRIMKYGIGINLSAFISETAGREVNAIVRNVFTDGRCVLQLSASSAKELGQEAVVIRPERLWAEKSNVDFISRYPKFRKEREYLLIKLSGFAFDLINQRRKTSQKWCTNAALNDLKKRGLRANKQAQNSRRHNKNL